ncbi:hypothetical protein [Oceanicola granulosus]|uniref:hypothetical protein n=1 Tax=Oceanicola granulosus TaxID=252302 RepID=UPI0012EA8915|nr:hypothetical protein [Oceanicola granulosus]
MTSVRASIPAPGGGWLVMTGFPGLESGIDGTPYIDPESLDATLTAVRAFEAGLLVVLAEEGELPAGSFGHLAVAAARHGIELAPAPIADFSTPGPAFEATWASLGGRVHGRLAEGGAVGLCCQYGAGRSGMIAARVLIERDLPADEAIAAVRIRFGEAIENRLQEEWLKNFSDAGQKITS